LSHYSHSLFYRASWLLILYFESKFSSINHTEIPSCLPNIPIEMPPEHLQVQHIWSHDINISSQAPLPLQ
jgi:hypothetical protein